MTWKEYYDRYDGWQESSQYSRLASITDFGPETSPAEDIVDCVQFVNEKTAQSILHRAISAGVLFSGAQIEELLNVGIFEDAKDVRLLLHANTGDFTADNLVEILCCVSDSTEVESLISELSSKPTHFKPKEAISLYEEMSDETIANKMLLSVDTRFSEEDINELCDWGADEAVIKKLCRQSGIPYADPY